MGVKGSWLPCARVGVLLQGDRIGLTQAAAYSPGMVDMKTVCGEKPHPMRGDSVCAEHSGYKEVNLEKQSQFVSVGAMHRG